MNRAPAAPPGPNTALASPRLNPSNPEPAAAPPLTRLTPTKVTAPRSTILAGTWKPDMRPTNRPFRRNLLRRTVSNMSDAHKLAAKVERAGDRTVMLAIAWAKQAGTNWRPAAAEIGRRLADHADRLRTRLGPLRGPGSRAALIACAARMDDLPSDV